MPQKHYEQLMTGVGEESLDVFQGYRTNQISIKDLAIGTATVRVIARGNNAIESVVDGTITLSDNKTVTIKDAQIDQIFVSVSAGTPYTLLVDQSERVY